MASLADEPVSQETREVLADLCESVAIVSVQSKLRKLRMAYSILTGGIASLAAFRSAQLEKVIDSWAASTPFDLAIASASNVAPYLESNRLSSVPKIVDLVDVDSEKWLNYASSSTFPKSWIYQREGSTLRTYEQHIASWAKAISLVSEAETDLFETIAPAANLQTISNGVDLEYFQPATIDPCPLHCVFVGALDYHPNIDAVCWFAENVWPQVRQKHSDAIFQVVGRKPIQAVLDLGRRPGIEVIGQVPDVRPYVHRAAVVVAPLRIARGLQNKVLEAMAMAKPVVASPAALAGLLQNVCNPAIRAESVEEWLTALDRLFSNKDRDKTLGQQGREYVEANYQWDLCLEPLHRLVENCPDHGSENKEPQPVTIAAR